MRFYCTEWYNQLAWSVLCLFLEPSWLEEKKIFHDNWVLDSHFFATISIFIGSKERKRLPGMYYWDIWSLESYRRWFTGGALVGGLSVEWLLYFSTAKFSTFFVGSYLSRFSTDFEFSKSCRKPRYSIFFRLEVISKNTIDALWNKWK